VSLRDIIGQEKAVAMLSGILARQKVASAYLFCGEAGVGKKTTAISFAKALNCWGDSTAKDEESPGVEVSGKASHSLVPHASQLPFPDSCDKCKSCVKIDSGTHPDFLLVSPEDRQIRIEEIRRIEEALSFKPFEARNKVVIIDDAETMNISAANAFLKTLEEPPEDSVIILVSSKPDLLPATIRSRCSRINFVPLPTDSCMHVLRDKIKGENTLGLISRLSMGQPGRALSSDLTEERSWFLDLLKAMLRADKDGWTSRDDMERWFDQGLIFFRDLAVLAESADPSRLINSDLRDYLSSLGKSLDIRGILYIHRELSRLRRLLFFNLNKSITWNYTASLMRKELAG
jgi:DNA polymerase-3 subunit delta'